jgi:hypothetical protein
MPDSGGTIVLGVPDRLGVIQRRSYFRVSVPEALKVNVVLWHRKAHPSKKDNGHNYAEGRLVDISAGGAQILVPLRTDEGGAAGGVGESEFHRGQFIGMRFTPMPYETPLMFSAQVRSVLPTADRSSLCLGLQIVGLEVSEEGRHVLWRLAAVVERYHEINQSGVKQQDLQATVQAECPPVDLPAGALQ